MTAWDRTLAGVLDRVWREIGRETDAGPHYGTLATLGADGPEARMLALRGADREAGTVTLHTDLATPKVRQLRADARASLLVWVAERELQIRLTGAVAIASGAEVGDAWARVPEASRGNYGVKPPPGTAIDAAEAYTRVADRDKFAVLTLTVAAIDAVMLAPAIHRRAAFRRDDGWRGTWLAP